MSDPLPIDDKAFETLSAHVKASEEANRLKQTEINLLRRREQLSFDERDATVKLRAEVERMIIHLRELSEEIAAARLAQQLTARRVDDLTKQQEQLESNMILLLTEHSPQRVKAAAETAEADLSRRRMLRKHRDNLAKLEEQAAEYGPLDIPLKVQNAIEILKNKIVELEE